MNIFEISKIKKELEAATLWENDKRNIYEHNKKISDQVALEFIKDNLKHSNSKPIILTQLSINLIFGFSLYYDYQEWQKSFTT
jgi:hypothetical protein